MDIETYKKFAKARIEMNQRIIRTYMEKPQIIKAGRALGIVKGGTLVLEDEDDVNRVMDFGTRIQKTNGLRAIDRAYEEQLWENEYEKAYLEGLIASKETLFEVISSDPVAKTITVKEKLSKNTARYTMNDIGYSETVIPGSLMYICLVPLEDSHIGNGGAFCFAPHKTDLLMFDCNRPKNRIMLRDKAKAYKFFYKQYHKIGVTTVFQDLD